MREIKFRAWDTDNKIMCEVYRIEFFNEGTWVDCIPHLGNIRRVLNIKENPIMQYTGLKDKNGKEIYEGDIVRLNNAMGLFFVAEIKMVDGCFEIYVPELRQRDYLKCYVVNYAVEVIGNIYENPELLGNE